MDNVIFCAEVFYVILFDFVVEIERQGSKLLRNHWKNNLSITFGYLRSSRGFGGFLAGPRGYKLNIIG